MPGELPAVMNVLDGAMLETDAAAVRDGIDRGDVLVAAEDGRVLGAVVLAAGDGTSVAEATDLSRLHDTTAPANREDASGYPDVVESVVVEAVAVRPRRRGQGIGTDLVEAVAGRRGALIAEFDDGVRPFYESLGFHVDSVGPGRYRGVRPAD